MCERDSRDWSLKCVTDGYNVYYNSPLILKWSLMTYHGYPIIYAYGFVVLCFVYITVN